MRRIGLIGGMSWTSTTAYYDLINRFVNAKLGGLRSADVVMHSLDFAEIERMQVEDRWDDAAARLSASARMLESMGAGAVVICTNTMHKVAAAVADAVGAELLHIADAVAREATRRGYGRVLLLGTRYVMEQPFLTAELGARGLEVTVPGAALRERVHGLIFDELCRGEITDGGRSIIAEAAEAGKGEGAEAMLLCCTELGLVFPDGDSGEAKTAAWCELPALCSAMAHARAAAEWALDADV